MKRFSYRVHQQQFRAACDWIVALGVNLNLTRVEEYSRLLEKIPDYYEADRIAELLDDQGGAPLFNAMFEASEFMHIHEGLGGQPDPELLRRLREFVAGAAMLTDETASKNQNRPRNIGFELSIAAAAAKSELPISLESPADLWIREKSAPRVAVECKRPFTARKVEANVSDGLHQLADRYDASPDPVSVRGILAVSITRTENDGSKVLAGDNEGEVRGQINSVFEQFIARHERHWLTTVDGRTLAVLLELSAPAFVKTPSIFAVARQYAWLPLCAPSSPGRAQFDAIASAFQRLDTPS